MEESDAVKIYTETKKVNGIKIILNVKKSGVALLQLSLTLHITYSRKTFRYRHSINFNLYFLCFAVR